MDIYFILFVYTLYTYIVSVGIYVLLFRRAQIRLSKCNVGEGVNDVLFIRDTYRIHIPSNNCQWLITNHNII